MARAMRISAWVCGALAVLLWMGPSLLRPDISNGDATQHVYWLYRYADRLLFPNDLSIEYFASDSVAPWGYRALYAMLVPFGDALFVAKLVAAALLAWTLVLAWRLGAQIVESARPVAGLVAVTAIVVLLTRSDLLPAMGFQRTFALPLTLLCLWALVARRYVWVGVSWVAAALFYPVIIPVLGLTAAVVFLGDLLRERRMPPLWQWNALLGVAAIAIVVFGSGTPEGIGPMVTYEQALAMPEFGAGGRQTLFGTSWIDSWFFQGRMGLGWSPKIVLAMAAAVAVTFALRRRKLIPPAAWALAAVGVVLWFVSRLILFTLYLPNRHSRMALAAFAMVVFMAAAFAVLQAVSARWPKGGARAFWGLAFLAPLVVVGALLPTALAAWQRPVDRDMERAYQFIATLPKDTLVAAHPDLADFVPLRSQRSVLVSTEVSIAFMQGYYRRLVPRIEASLRAAYASSWDEVESALDPYHVNVMLTAPRVWTETTYYPPFDKLARGLIERGKLEGFVLQNPPPDRILFRSGDVYVLRVGAGPGSHG